MENLLKLLKQNARYSTEELAVLVGATEEEVTSQIKEYEKNGIIKGYTVILNEELIDDTAVTAIIELKVTPQRDFGFDEIASKIMKYKEVQSLTLLSGAYDLSLYVTGKNVKEVGLFVSQKLSIIEGIISTSTYFILKRYKEKGICINFEETDERGMVSP